MKQVLLLLAAIAVSMLQPATAEARVKLIVVTTAAPDPLALPLVTPAFPAGCVRGVKATWIGSTANGAVLASTTGDGIGTYGNTEVASGEYARWGIKLGNIVLADFNAVPGEGPLLDPVTMTNYWAYLPSKTPGIFGLGLTPGFILITPTP